MTAPLDPYAIVGPILRKLDPERAHELGLLALESGLVPSRPPIVDPILATTLLGREIAHPLGLAAGFDKNARVYRRMLGQGFAWVEVGGVTPRPQSGNPRPRVFRLPRDRAVINRIGFANDGLERVAERMRANGDRGERLVGVNLAANTDNADPVEDFVRLERAFAPLCDFVTLDLSCPNTANGKLFLEPAPLEELLGRLDRERATRTMRASDRIAAPASDRMTAAAISSPQRTASVADRTAPSTRRAMPALVVKLAPGVDETRLAALLDVVRRHPIAAIIVSNTTTERPDGLRDPDAAQTGGLSGPPLFASSTRMLADVRALTGGRIPLIGVGGITTGDDAYAKIRAGASALQLYTALVYAGPAGVDAIVRDLAARLRADGFTSVADAVGTASS